MPTTAQVDGIVAEVKKRWAEAEAKGIHMRVSGQNLDDGWLIIAVEPTRAGIRASEYANFMSKVERELRDSGADEVLLVPALDD